MLLCYYAKLLDRLAVVAFVISDHGCLFQQVDKCNDEWIGHLQSDLQSSFMLQWLDYKILSKKNYTNQKKSRKWFLSYITFHEVLLHNRNSRNSKRLGDTALLHKKCTRLVGLQLWRIAVPFDESSKSNEQYS